MSGSDAAAPAAGRGWEGAGSPQEGEPDKRNGYTSPAQYASVHWDSYDHDHGHEAVCMRPQAGLSSVSSATPAAVTFAQDSPRKVVDGHGDAREPISDGSAGDAGDLQPPYESRRPRQSWDVKGKGKAQDLPQLAIDSLRDSPKAHSSSLASAPLPLRMEDSPRRRPLDVVDLYTHDRDGNSIHGDVPRRRKKRSNTWAPSDDLSWIRGPQESSASDSDDEGREHIRRSYSSYSARRTRTPSPVQYRRESRSHLPHSASEFLPSSVSGQASSQNSRRQTPRSGSPMAFSDLRPSSAELKPHDMPFSRPSSSSNLSNMEAPARPAPLRKRTSGLQMRPRSGSRSNQTSRQVSEVQPRKRAKSNLSFIPQPGGQSPPQQSPVRQSKARTFSNDGPRLPHESSSKVAFPVVQEAPLTQEPAALVEKDHRLSIHVSEQMPGMRSSRSRPFSLSAMIQEGEGDTSQVITSAPEQSLLDIIKQVDVRAAHALVREVQAGTKSHSRQASMAAHGTGAVDLVSHSPVLSDAAGSSAAKLRVASHPSTISIQDERNSGSRAPLLTRSPQNPASPTMSDISAVRRGSIVIRDPAIAQKASHPVRHSVVEPRKKRRLSQLFPTPSKRDKGKQQAASDDEQADARAKEAPFDVSRITPDLQGFADDVKTELENFYGQIYACLAAGGQPPNFAEIARWRCRREEIAARRKTLASSQASLDRSSSRKSLNGHSVFGGPLIDRLRGSSHKQSRWTLYARDLERFTVTKGSLWETFDHASERVEQVDDLRRAVAPSAGTSRRPPYHHHASSDLSLRSLESIHEEQMLASAYDGRYRYVGNAQDSQRSVSHESNRHSPVSHVSAKGEGLGLAHMPVTPKSSTSAYSSQPGHMSDRLLSPGTSVRKSSGNRTSPDSQARNMGTNASMRFQQGLSPASSFNRRYKNSMRKELADSGGEKATRISPIHSGLDAAATISPTSGPSDSENAMPRRTQTDPKPVLSRQTSRSSSIVNLSKIMPRRSGRFTGDAEGYRSVDDGEATDRSFTARFRKPTWKTSIPAMQKSAPAGLMKGEDTQAKRFIATPGMPQEAAYDVFADLKQPIEIAVVGLDEGSMNRAQR